MPFLKVLQGALLLFSPSGGVSETHFFGGESGTTPIPIELSLAEIAVRFEPEIGIEEARRILLRADGLDRNAVRNLDVSGLPFSWIPVIPGLDAARVFSVAWALSSQPGVAYVGPV